MAEEICRKCLSVCQSVVIGEGRQREPLCRVLAVINSVSRLRVLQRLEEQWIPSRGPCVWLESGTSNDFTGVCTDPGKSWKL